MLSFEIIFILVSNKKRRSVEVQFPAYLFSLRRDNGPQPGTGYIASPSAVQRKPSVDWY